MADDFKSLLQRNRELALQFMKLRSELQEKIVQMNEFNIDARHRLREAEKHLQMQPSYVCPSSAALQIWNGDHYVRDLQEKTTHHIQAKVVLDNSTQS